MTILALGTCLVITAVAQTHWQAPRLFRPLLMLGQRSYEVYLTHMFVIFALFRLFVFAGKPMLVFQHCFSPSLFLQACLAN